MILQSCVATTTLQKGGGNQKGAEFSKVFQGFLSKIVASAGSMALNQGTVLADKVIIYVLYFIQFVVYTMRNPVIYRTAKKVVFC